MSQPQPTAMSLLDQVEARAAEVGVAMATAILREVEPMKAVNRNDPTFRLRFVAFCERHVRTFVDTTRLGRVAGPADLEFLREVAVRRADDAFPLAELMEGLRVGHRVLSRFISQLGSGWDTPADTVLWLTSRLIDYMDAAGALLADSYRERQRLSAGRAQLTRREMLDDLIEGRYPSRPDAGLVAGSVGFEPDEQYCVAVLIATGDDPQRTLNLAAEVSQAAFSRATFRFVVPRGEEVVAISRVTETRVVVSLALESFGRKYSAFQARAGISTSCRGIGEVARAYWEAVRALRFTSETESLVDLRLLGPLRYLEFSADAVARRLAAQCAGPLVAKRALADTVVAFVECGLNAAVTAKRMGVHMNTVHNRLERAAEMVALPELRPIDLVEIAASIRICRKAGAM